MNQRFLLLIAVGPVQEFIQSARRTRDLWFGSRLLLELVGVVASEIENNGGKMIYPSLDASSVDGRTNKVLAILEDKDRRNIQEMVIALRRSFDGAWRSKAQAALDTVSRVTCSSEVLINEARFWFQVSDALEFYAAWRAWPIEEKYLDAKSGVEGMLGARKMIRDFRPNLGDAISKSSLDGARESVLLGKLSRSGDERLGIREGEALDAVGLIKRVGTLDDESTAYPSVVRVAVDPWVRTISSCEELSPLWAQLNEVTKGCASLGNGVITTTNKPAQYKRLFPYDGKTLLPGWRSTLDAKALDENSRNKLDDALTELRKKARELGLPDYPSPYLALLKADGDRMGALFSSIESEDGHRRITETMLEFSKEARQIVEQEHGVTVYCGGDDVFAFLPLDASLRASRRLHDAFEKHIGKHAHGAETPTLSVGLGIGHCREDLRFLRGLAETAESSAKEPDKNGFSVVVATRSGDAVTWRRSWTVNPDGELFFWTSCIRKGIFPHGVAYELRQLYNRLSHIESEISGERLVREVKHLLARKRITSENIFQRISGDLQDAIYANINAALKPARYPVVALKQLCDLLIVATWFARQQGFMDLDNKGGSEWLGSK